MGLSAGQVAPNSPRVHLLIEAAIIAAALAVTCIRAQDQPLSQTALSRLASVVALTEDGVWYIDHGRAQPPNPFEARTIDKVQVRGRLISSKPPLMPRLMAWEYGLLRSAFGWTLDNIEDTRRILYVYTLTFCALPWAAALMAAAVLLRKTVASVPGRTIALIALAFGTQTAGFASVFNNHVPAAAALVVCACLVFQVRSTSASRPVVSALAGLAGGLCAAFDVPNASYIVTLGFLLMMHGKPRNWVLFGLAAAIPVAAQSALLFQITGYPEPVQLRPEYYIYESSYWRNPSGIDAFSEPKGTYAFNMLFGNHGILLLYPVLCAGIAGFAIALVARTRYRAEILAAGLCFVAVVSYYVLNTNNYGGEVYGMRWLIPSMPVLVLMGVPVWQRANAMPWWIAGTIAAAISAWSAWESGSTPWESGREWINRF